MKVSLEWLRQYVETGTDEQALADLLTMAGLEVEAVYDPYRHLSSVVVGRIVSTAPHPNADRLRCCEVDIGSETLTIVCGAPNAEAGMLAPCALAGTVLPSGVTVEKTKIRGLQSEGMLCSRAELGLGEDTSGLMRLPDGLAPGTGLSRALDLWDRVFEIGLTPNRPDCLCHIGVAREIAALRGEKLRLPEIPPPENRGRARELTSVTIENPELCRRYAAQLVFDVTVAASPAWLQRRLRAVGLKPINNIVDITNYVMMETGQPLHAFDFDRLEGHRIVVRTPRDESRFVTLDGKSRTLDAETLLICDGEKPVAIAGVMGGENSEILPGTTRVLIESACFDPVSIRKTAKRLGIATDASYRFERGVDPEGTVCAMNRAARLMAELGNATLVEGIIDAHPRPAAKKVISLSPKRTNRHLGTRLSRKKIAGYLESIGFSVVWAEDGRLAVTPPSFRVDVERPEDLMEEVARLRGYNRIATTFPRLSALPEPPGRALALKERIRDLMEGFGFHEAVTYSFTAESAADRLGLVGDDPRRDTVSILNPLSEDQGVMRTTLLPGLLQTVQKNIFRQEKNLKIFETGKAFYNATDRELPREVEMVTALWTGLRAPLSWHAKPAAADFYDIKGVAESLLAGLGIDGAVFSKMPRQACSYTEPGRTAQVRCGDTFVGLVGEVRSPVLKRFDIRQPVFALEIHLEALLPHVPDVRPFTPIPRFPAATRDITLIVDKNIEGQRILDQIGDRQTGLIEDVLLFDVYSGAPVPEGKKSISIRITYRSHERTLEDADVNALHRQITEGLLAAFGAALPE